MSLIDIIAQIEQEVDIKDIMLSRTPLEGHRILAESDGLYLLSRPVTCLRCGNTWTPDVLHPMTCAECRSPFWDKPRQREQKQK